MSEVKEMTLIEEFANKIMSSGLIKDEKDIDKFREITCCMKDKEYHKMKEVDDRLANEVVKLTAEDKSKHRKLRRVVKIIIGITIGVIVVSVLMKVGMMLLM